MKDLVVVQKRGSLLVGRYNVLISSEAELLAKDTWNGDDKGSEEENSHDGESKDPLESNDMCGELANAKSSCQYTECEAHGVVLEDNEEEEPIDEDTPDSYIGQDASWETMAVGCNSTVPVESNKRPCQWPRDNGDMNETGMCVVSEIEGGQVEEVGNENDLCPNVVSSNEEHNEGELQQVVEDEMTPDSRGGVHVIGVGGEEMPNISDLEDPEDNPVDRGDDFVQSERSIEGTIHSPNGMTPMLQIILRNVEGIVDGGDGY